MLPLLRKVGSTALKTDLLSEALLYRCIDLLTFVQIQMAARLHASPAQEELCHPRH